MPACENCCIGCDIVNDTFDGALSAWTVVSGTWNTAGGRLTNTGAGILLLNASRLTAFDGDRFTIEAQTSDTSANLRLLGSYTDANNHLFGQFNINGAVGQVRLGQLVSASSSWLTNAATVRDNTAALLDDNHLIRLCWQPGTTQTPQSTFISLLGTSATVEGSNAPALLECDEVVEVFGLSNITPTKGCQVSFAGGIPAGSTVNGIAYAITVSSTQSTTITGTVSFSAGAASGTSATFVVTDSLSTFSGGGPTTPYGATWQDVNGLNGPVSVSASITRATAPAGDVVSVDCLAITIHYTTPANTPGTLKLQYVNSLDGSTQCVEASCQAIGDGLKVAIQVTSGTWNFEVADLDYQGSDTLHRTCTTCPCPEGQCDDCCDPNFPPASRYSLDFGDGGWTGSVPCQLITGVIVVARLAQCYFAHTFSSSAAFVYLILASDGTDCRWLAVASVVSAGKCSWAVYESPVVADTDCQVVPVTLTKREEGTCPPAPDELPEECSGDLPDEIELDIP